MGVIVSQSKWYAVQVRPTKEHKVYGSLLAKGYECLLPFSSFRRLTAKGVGEVRRALFPGYLFCRLNLQENRMPLLLTPDVFGLVGFRGGAVPVEDTEIAAIRQIADAEFTVEPWPYVKAGSQVQLVAGPLSGLSGMVIERSDSTRLVVSVELLQRSVAVQIPSNWAYSHESTPRPLLDEPLSAA